MNYLYNIIDNLLGTSLRVDQIMNAGDYLMNSAGWLFLMQSDCNAVLYDDQGAPKWVSNTAYGEGCFLKMQTNCNLVLFRVLFGAPEAIWKSNTIDRDDTGCQLLLDTTSSLVILGSTGQIKASLYDARE